MEVPLPLYSRAIESWTTKSQWTPRNGWGSLEERGICKSVPSKILNRWRVKVDSDLSSRTFPPTKKYLRICQTGAKISVRFKKAMKVVWVRSATRQSSKAKETSKIAHASLPDLAWFQLWRWKTSKVKSKPKTKSESIVKTKGESIKSRSGENPKSKINHL